MKKSVIFILLVALTVNIFSESLWSGNASIASDGEFTENTDYFQAASNTFPSGTMLKVTNPRNGLSVNVRVVKRLSRPGVFILLDKKSGEIIDLPDDHVMPVRVTPVSGGSGVLPDDELPAAEKIYSDDPDLNISSEAESFKDKEYSAVPEIPEVDIVDKPKTENIEKYEIEEDTNSVTLSENTVSESDESESESKSEEIEIYAETDSKSENVIYFLSPADLRPPEETTDTEKSSSLPAESAEISDSGAKEEVGIFPEEHSESSGTVVTGTQNPGNTVKINVPSADLSEKYKYIQIGAYEIFAVLADTYGKIKQKAPGYPLCYSEDTVNGNVVYKLLIGPLMPAETGTVLNTAKKTAFPDAFIYKYGK